MGLDEKPRVRVVPKTRAEKLTPQGIGSRPFVKIIGAVVGETPEAYYVQVDGKPLTEQYQGWAVKKEPIRDSGD